MKRIQIMVFSWLLLCTTGAGAQQDAVGKLLQSTATLIEESSLARRIAEAGDDQARAGYEQARGLYLQARQAYEAGDNDKARELAAAAKQRMLTAARGVGDGGAGADKARRDYEARAASVNALLQAQGRVASEKATNGGESQIQGRVAPLLAEADRLAGSGDYQAARASLDQAYQEITASIERMREGETLESRIEFKTKQDEFDYYWGKTESQLEAIELAAKSVAGTPKEKVILAFSKEMRAARDQARSQAKSGDLDGAIASLLPIFQRAPFQLMSLLR